MPSSINIARASLVSQARARFTRCRNALCRIRYGCGSESCLSFRHQKSGTSLRYRDPLLILSSSFTHAAFSRRQWVRVSNCSRQQVSTTLHGVRRKLVFAHFVYPFVRGPGVPARSSGPFSCSSAVCVMIALNGSIIFQRLRRTFDTVREEATGIMVLTYEEYGSCRVKKTNGQMAF